MFGGNLLRAYKVTRDFYVFLFTHERRAVLTTKNSSWKRKYELIVIKLTNQYVCYNLCEKHKKFFLLFFNKVYSVVA
jgi:hypothetical protein